MDVVLEIFDTYLFDRIYATLVPATTIPTSTASIVSKLAGGNDTYSNIARHVPGPAWTWHPATTYYSLEPSLWAYLSAWPRDNLWRQVISLFVITWLFGAAVYFLCASLSYIFIFDKATFHHPKFLKNQIRMEIAQTLEALPIMAILTVPFFIAEVRGYGRLYDHSSDGPGRWYDVLQFPLFICFTDFCIYWIHRGLHHPMVYKRVHKPHHKWIMPTPYASHAFHPLDGFSQSIPYHVFPFLFPLQKFAYIALFVFINIWTVVIHDGEYIADSPLINGAACHTMHHLYFNYNYGQFTTLWDRLGGSYRKPNKELFLRETKMGKKEWARQTQEIEKMQLEVEGTDDRHYDESDVKKVQ